MNLSSLELKIPPPLVGLFVALLMWLASRTVAPFEWPLVLRGIAGLSFVIVGVGFALAGVRSFARAQTTVNPTKPAATSSLVVTGIYRFTRNPMYLGLTSALAGIALLLGSLTPWLLVTVFFLLINQLFVR